jgi:hypothetical protein
MALIKLGKRNDAGEDVGPCLLNTDQIVAVISGPRATEIQTSDGHTHWVRETPDQVLALVSSPPS